MSVRQRQAVDRGFTTASLASVVLIAAALVVVLAPILCQAVSAVAFRGTAAFRQMQRDLYGRGDPAVLKAEADEVARAQAPLWALVEQFRQLADTTRLEDRARQIYRDLGEELEHRGVTGNERREIRRLARDLRDDLVQAFESTDKAAAQAHLESVLGHEADPQLAGKAGAALFAMAHEYQKALETMDLGHRQEYGKAFAEVEDALVRLLGPAPGTPTPPLAMNRYGATRMSLVEKALDDLLYAEQWVKAEGSDALVRRKVPREEQFAGTPLAALFPMARDRLDDLLHPRWTFYWQYFIDDSVPGHFFGGVGPEILGTLAITVLAILLALPLGVMTAAYLIEVAGDNLAVRFLRMCINTLAGVPSIVFGLFGLAFVILWLFPHLGLEGRPCVLAAAITLAVLVLPVVIRASEEAIRAVPRTYKEAALALGAGRLRCFLTVQLPAALPGILTGVILSMSRAAGETAPILFTGAVALGPALHLFGHEEGGLFGWLFQQTRTLSYGSYDLATGDRIAAMVPHQQYGMVATLVVLVLVLNAAAILIRWKIERRLRGR